MNVPRTFGLVVSMSSTQQCCPPKASEPRPARAAPLTVSPVPHE